MQTNKVIRVTIATVSALGGNAIPLGLVLFGGNSTATAFTLYFLETLLAVFLTALYIYLRAPTQDPAYEGIASSATTIITNRRVTRRYERGSRKTLLDGYLLFSLAFTLAPGAFLALMVFGQKLEVSSAAIQTGMVGIAIFQLIKFVSDFFTVGQLSPQAASDYLNGSMGRVAIIYLSIFIGTFLALLISAEWFVYPFAALKISADFASIFQRKTSPPL